MFKLITQALAGAAFVGLSASAAQATYTTTLSFDPQLPNTGTRSITIEWDTHLTSGAVYEDDLTELTFILDYDDGLWTDRRSSPAWCSRSAASPARPSWKSRESSGSR